MRIGYACLNQSLRNQGENKRCMNKRAFEKRGLEGVAEIALHNLDHLKKVILWNEKRGIRLFRWTQLFPWVDKYNLSDLPHWDTLQEKLREIRVLADSLGHRLTLHPSEFCVMASPRESSVLNSARELNHQAKVFLAMGYPPSPFTKINIHIGGTYGNKSDTQKRFCDNLLEHLQPETLRFLTLENEDRPNGHSLRDLYEGVYPRLGIPLVFDYFHHRFNTGGLSEKEALDLAVSTWPPSIPPVVHFSSPRRGSKSKVAHSDYICREVPTYGYDLDIMLEAKMTEKAVIRYMRKFWRRESISPETQPVACDTSPLIAISPSREDRLQPRSLDPGGGP